MKLRCFALLCAFAVFTIGFSPPSEAQATAGPFTISSSSSPCAKISVTGQGSVVAKVSGTFSITLQPELSMQGQPPDNTVVTPSTSTSGTKQGTITAAGSYSAAVGSYDTFLVCVSSYVSGTATIYLNTSPVINAGLFTSTPPATTFDAIGSGTNTTATMVVGTGASLAPSGTGQSVAQTGIGQVAGSQLWLQPGLSTVTPTAANSGGNILTGHLVLWAYTLNSTLGETTPSDTTSNGMSTLSAGACVSTACTTSIAPTVPTGYTGFTAYFCDTSGAACTTPQKVLACVNITGTCTVTSAALNSGVALPTKNTAYVAPPNVQNTLCPSSIIPSIYAFKADGNSYTEQGMDFSNGTPLPAPNGTSIWCDRFFVSDSKQTLADATQQGGGLMRNALVSLSHLSGNSTSTGATTDDRVITVRGTDSPTSPTYEQWLGYYGEQFTYNNNFACGPTGGAGGEDCIAAIRARADDARPAGVNNITLVGIHGTASTDVAAPKVGGANPAVTGVMGSALQAAVTNQNGNGAIYAGVWGNMVASSSNTNGTGVAVGAGLGAVRFATQNIGFYLNNSIPGTNAIDYSIRSDSTARSGLAGALYLGGNPGIASGGGTLNVTGGIADTGSLGALQLTTPSFANGNVTNSGATGATTWTYKVVAKDANGNGTAVSAAGTTTIGNATLTGSNFNVITLNFCNGSTGLSANILGYSSVDVYRTAAGGTPNTTGKIGTITPTYVGGSSAYGTCNFTLNDTGLAGDGSTPQTVNTTAAVQGFKLQTITACAAVGTAANPSVVSCSAASAGIIYCDIAASAGTCTVNTSAVTTASEIHIQASGADGTLLSKTCNTAPTVVPFALLGAKSNGVSFTINMPTGTVNGFCFEYVITN